MFYSGGIFCSPNVSGSSSLTGNLWGILFRRTSALVHMHSMSVYYLSELKQTNFQQNTEFFIYFLFLHIKIFMTLRGINSVYVLKEEITRIS